MTNFPEIRSAELTDGILCILTRMYFFHQACTVYCCYCLVPHPRAQLYTYHHLQPTNIETTIFIIHGIIPIALMGGHIQIVLVCQVAPYYPLRCDSSEAVSCNMRPSPQFAHLSQKAPGMSADSRRMAKGIVPVAPTGTRGRRPSMEDTGITYKTGACSRCSKRIAD
jgi:hypothetical protein